MSRHRTWTDRQFVDAVRDNYSIAGVLRALGLRVTGANYGTVHDYVARFKLDKSHWTGQGHRRGKPNPWTPAAPLSTVLVRGRRYSSSSLKRRLLNEGMLKNRCACCRQPTTWHGGKLVMVLDHVNGDHADNRLENLRLLCPNCNSQQPTFCRGQGYPAEFRARAIKLAHKLGNNRKAARELGISSDTMQVWLRAARDQAR